MQARRYIARTHGYYSASAAGWVAGKTTAEEWYGASYKKLANEDKNVLKTKISICSSIMFI